MAKQQVLAFAGWALAASAMVVFLPAAVSGARDVKAAANRGFVVEGCVFCDTCRAGFETPKTTYIADEHEHENCESVLVSSPVKGCDKILAGRERAPVFLTHNNGIASDKRFANSLGFQKDIPVAGCARLLEMYQQYENEV
ncbi:pollen-specific protein C13 [Cocos nucifera]|uniref:Pollen-specific protein C13 n=1 Tax=Cocos nucifera TaxID=13894 RepID=A0A8K0I2W4_COCNU|nr:pollen-specific protein C13 [Cocos nucifera]